MPICETALQRGEASFYATDSLSRKIPSAPVLFFCPCAADVLRRLDPEGMRSVLPHTVPRPTSESVWQRLVVSLDTTCTVDQAVALLLRSRKFIANPYIDGMMQQQGVGFWSAEEDEGVEVVIREIPQDGYWSNITLLDDELMIDAGSNVGAVSILTAAKYPHVRIVAVEAVPFTWVYQQVNIHSLLPEADVSSGRIRSELAALGADTDGALRMQYRPKTSTSSRNWNPDNEASWAMCNITVQFVSLRTLLTRQSLSDQRIAWLKMDCEGCEYQVVPDMSPAELARIGAVSGEFHVSHIAQWNPKMLPDFDRVARTLRGICPKFSRPMSDCHPKFLEELRNVYRRHGKPVY